jgi:hypothetical protein
MKPHGLLAMYPTAELLADAMRRLRAAGYSHFEAYTPYPDEEVDDLLPAKPTPIGWVVLIAGLLGGAGAYFMQWYAAHDYAINVGGRPLHSWPSFVPITFELTVLTGSFVGAFALFVLARLPRLDHPLFQSPQFLRASQDRFFVCVLASEPHYAQPNTRDLLSDGAENIEEVNL